MTQLQPLHSDKSRGSFIQLLSPVLGVVMVVLGLMGPDVLTVAMGAGLLAYVWFTQHRRFDIFQDRLVIYYGTPRIRSVPLSDIGETRLIKGPLGGQDLLVRRKGGGVLVIRPRDVEQFAAALDKARGVSKARPAEAPHNRPPRPRGRRSRNRTP